MPSSTPTGRPDDNMARDADGTPSATTAGTA